MHKPPFRRISSSLLVSPVLIFFCFFLQNPLQSEVLLGIVSSRSAPEVAAGAEEIIKNRSNVEVRLRTPEQLRDLSDQEIVNLWSDADAICIGAVFGPVVPRLNRLLTEQPPPENVPIVCVSCDMRLNRTSRINGQFVLKNVKQKTYKKIIRNPGPEDDPESFFRDLSRRYPDRAEWIKARGYWQSRGQENMVRLMRYLFYLSGTGKKPAPPAPKPPIRYYRFGNIVSQNSLSLEKDRPVVAILDLDTGGRTGNRRIHDRLQKNLRNQNLTPVSIFARWGDSSIKALEKIPSAIEPGDLSAIIALQDFTIGGGHGQEKATKKLKSLDVPVLKAMKLNDQTVREWRLSPKGIPWDQLHYKVTMPEMQGMSQPIVIAASGKPKIHGKTGVQLVKPRVISKQVDRLTQRTKNWSRLQEKENQNKKVGIIYYNHPPGRHNIGADNLNVEESLFQILKRLKKEGYQTGPLPESPDALLNKIQKQGLNLPENQKALTSMTSKVPGLSTEEYKKWFATLPRIVREEVVNGPPGYLHHMIRKTLKSNVPKYGKKILDRMTGDLEHLLEHVNQGDHQKTLNRFHHLMDTYRAILEGDKSWEQAEKAYKSFLNSEQTGLGGWGAPPGKSMTVNGEFLFPGVRFQNVFMGVQPPRGWEIDEELLHSNTTFPPTHQYLAFYHWLRSEFEADVLVHVGRHSTYEWLPWKKNGLSGRDYPVIVSGQLPGIYPYIVDGVGEGLTAKRRGRAVIVDHLTPPLKSTPLYNRLLELRQLVETYESSRADQEGAVREKAIERIRNKIASLNMKEELINEMKKETGSDEINLKELPDDELVHRVGHYLTELQEDFMPSGLHTFGKKWPRTDVEMMLNSMSDGEESPDPSWRKKLVASPKNEMSKFLNGLNGKFVPPGKGNDPIRTPDVLPTGRNFHSINGRMMPTNVAYELAGSLVNSSGTTHAEDEQEKRKESGGAVVLWASDTVRDNGVMVGFGLQRMGIKPVWNSRGIVKGLKRTSPPDGIRRDTIFNTSGLFRDIYPNLIRLVDRAALLALDGSSETIRNKYPALRPALDAALSRLGNESNHGNESLKKNRVARSWVRDVRKNLKKGMPLKKAGITASYRVFGPAPGSYGASVNRLVERSGAWSDRRQIVRTYLNRMGHAYGSGIEGAEAEDAFRTSLKKIDETYLGRASNLYGLMDNNDGYDYLGGMSMAIEELSGSTPKNRVVDYAQPEHASVEPLQVALHKELRSRYLNPNWIKPLMDEGYSGARTMGSKFVEFLWGWQVTTPHLVEDWVWEDVRGIYLKDRLNLGLDKFLEKENNVHVKTNMTAIMLVAIKKGFWDADDQTVQSLSRRFARLVSEHGLPGSGHTSPDHPVMNWIEPKLPEELKKKFAERVQTAGGEHQTKREDGQSSRKKVTEVKHTPKEKKRAERTKTESTGQVSWYRRWGMIVLVLLLLTGGLIRGMRGGA